MAGSLESIGALKGALEAVMVGSASSKGANNWYVGLDTFLQEVRQRISNGTLNDRNFLQRLWDDDVVAGTGNGTVKISPALDDQSFREWFVTQAMEPLPADDSAAEAWLTQFWIDLNTRTKALCGRTPRLKNSRVLCALYPAHFTTVADVGALLKLHEEMGGMTKDHPVRAHRAIMVRIDEALGAVPADAWPQFIRRLCLPWYLFKHIDKDSASDLTSDANAPSSALIPLPATLRRKGLTAIKGSFQTLLGFMEDLSEGVTREEFSSLMKQANPDLAENSIGTAINVVVREFDLCRRDGDIYRLSARGINLRQTQDPDELADHLLTKVFGVDHVLKRLEGQAETKPGLMSLLQSVHPGWTTDFAPSALVGWMASLDLIFLGKDKRYILTERGERWCEQISWSPEALPKSTDDVQEVLENTSSTALVLPNFVDISKRIETLVAGRLRFDPELLEQLHAGLWAHPVRHLSVLTGISGSGKTQLALHYALALTGSDAADSTYVRVIPVQPGWFDPAPLLGYVNPIQDTSYRSAPFVELLLRAASDPGHPYVAILDELNLSHPEQYLAPVLSAMETHGWIDLHQMSDGLSPVPQRVQYPANLCIIGTLNMDETTHGLSDKVLDRAYTLEFWNIDVDAFPGWSAVGLSSAAKERARDVLKSLVQCLAPVRLHFGWRTIDDVLRYLAFREGMGGSQADALDAAIYAKVLPKLRGDSSPRFQKALQDTIDVLQKNELKRCTEKVKAMQEDLQSTGSARYWR